MNKVIQLLVLAISILYVTGCSTYKVNNYGMSADNIELMKELDGLQVSIKEITASKPGVTKIQCRGAGPVSTPNKETFEAYIKDALVSELKLAGIYSESSNIKISGTVKKLDFSSNIGAGKWMFDVSVSDEDGMSYQVNSIFNFSTNWVADKACQQVAQAFVPAVQNLIKDIVANPKFKALSN